MKARTIAFVLGVLVLILGFGLQILNSKMQQENNYPIGNRPPVTWSYESAHSSVQNSSGMLGVKGVLVTSRNAIFFYAAQGSNQKPLTAVSATSYSVDSEIQKSDQTISTQVQQLGVIDSYNVGVIKTALFNKPGQTLALHVKLADNDQSSLELSPLKQIGKFDPERFGFEFSKISSSPSAVESVLGKINGQRGEVFVKMNLTDGSSAPLFIKIHDQDEVSMISDAEYVGAVGVQQAVPVPSDLVNVPTERPTEIK